MVIFSSTYLRVEAMFMLVLGKDAIETKVQLLNYTGRAKFTPWICHSQSCHMYPSTSQGRIKSRNWNLYLLPSKTEWLYLWQAYPILSWITSSDPIKIWEFPTGGLEWISFFFTPASFHSFFQLGLEALESLSRVARDCGSGWCWVTEQIKQKTLVRRTEVGARA